MYKSFLIDEENIKERKIIVYIFLFCTHLLKINDKTQNTFETMS